MNETRKIRRCSTENVKIREKQVSDEREIFLKILLILDLIRYNVVTRRVEVQFRKRRNLKVFIN